MHLAESTGLRYCLIEEEQNEPAQAWCQECDRFVQADRGWTDRADAQAAWKLFCHTCFAQRFNDISSRLWLKVALRLNEASLSKRATLPLNLSGFVSDAPGLLLEAQPTLHAGGITRLQITSAVVAFTIVCAELAHAQQAGAGSHGIVSIRLDAQPLRSAVAAAGSTSIPLLTRRPLRYRTADSLA